MQRSILLLIFLASSSVLYSESLLITRDRAFLSIQEDWKTLKSQSGILRFHLLTGAYVSFPADQVDWEATRFFNGTRSTAIKNRAPLRTKALNNGAIQLSEHSWERLISGILEKLKQQERRLDSLAMTVQALKEAQRRVRRAGFHECMPVPPFSDHIVSANLPALDQASAGKLSASSKKD